MTKGAKIFLYVFIVVVIAVIIVWYIKKFSKKDVSDKEKTEQQQAQQIVNQNIDTTTVIGNNSEFMGKPIYAKYGMVKVYENPLVFKNNPPLTVYKTAAKDEYIGNVSKIENNKIYIAGNGYFIWDTKGAYYTK